MKKNSYLIFDIETRSLPANVLKETGVFPSFKAPSNYKDPDKIAAKESEHEAEVLARAALDPTLSQVCAIGYKEDGRDPIIDLSTSLDTKGRIEDERRMLNTFWRMMREAINNEARIVGFNIYGFDFPYLVKRSWLHKIQITDAIRRGRYWNENHTLDVAEAWKMGDKNSFISLDRLAKFLGVGSKDKSGKDFALMLEADKEQAIAYLKKDLELTELVAARLSLIDDDNP